MEPPLDLLKVADVTGSRSAPVSKIWSLRFAPCSGMWMPSDRIRPSKGVLTICLWGTEGNGVWGICVHCVEWKFLAVIAWFRRPGALGGEGIPLL